MEAIISPPSCLCLSRLSGGERAGKLGIPSRRDNPTTLYSERLGWLPGKAWRPGCGRRGASWAYQGSQNLQARKKTFDLGSHQTPCWLELGPRSRKDSVENRKPGSARPPSCALPLLCWGKDRKAWEPFEERPPNTHLFWPPGLAARESWRLGDRRGDGWGPTKVPKAQVREKAFDLDSPQTPCRLEQASRSRKVLVENQRP